MVTIVKRVLGAVLSLVGLGLVIVGVWFATELGTSGTAEFSAQPDTETPVLVRPDILNRVDADLVVTATPGDGGSVWMALANPSDASAVLGGSRHLEVTGVGVRDGALFTTARGSGEAPALGDADLWRQQDSADGPVSLTVVQSEAPETLVIAADGAPLESVTMTVTDKSWFVEAVVLALVGLFLLAGGAILLWPQGRRDRRGTDAVPPGEDAGQADSAPSDDGTADRGDPADDDTTAEEVAR